MKSLGEDLSEDDLKNLIAEVDLDSKLINMASRIIKLLVILNSIKHDISTAHNT